MIFTTVNFICQNGGSTQFNVIAYYPLSVNPIPQEGMPEDLLKKLKLPPSYRPLRSAGWLLTSDIEIGKHGELLLIDALNRCLNASQQAEILSAIVDPIDQKTIDFNDKYDFQALKTIERMFIIIQTLSQLIFPKN